MQPISIGGAWTFTPALHRDDRGCFLEWFRADGLSESLGYRPEIAQANCSISRRGVVRGVHFASVPPGQAKYVTCVSGAVLDVIVDVRVGSPSYGHWEAVRLDDASRRAVFLAEGLGHAFTAISDEATVIYLCSTPYSPGREHGVHPLDPDIGIEWPTDAEPVLSGKDAAAPTLEQACQPEPGCLPAARCMVDAGRGRGMDQRDDLPAHVDGPGGLAVLIVHHVDRRPLVLELDHRADEVRPVRSVQPRRPDDIARAGQA